jgi:6-phosphogluconolactonase (cycloisomerase 2 family)
MRFPVPLIGLLVLAGALLVPATASAGQIYVTGSGSTGNSVSPFSVGSNGSLTPISCPGSNCATGTAPIGVAMSPNGQHLYAANFTSSKVSVFSVAANGSLSPVTCSGSNCNTGTGPYGITVSPDGQYLYTANQTANTVSAFSIAADGSLTPISCPGSNCNTGTAPYGIAVSPGGQYLYTTNRTSNTVSVFSIGSGGSLTPVTCSTCTTASQPSGLAISPNGQYLYTANRSGASVGAYTINANGTLSAITCTTGCSTGTNGAFSLAISPDGRYLYSTIRNATAKVATFAINANGSLSQVTCSGSNCTTPTNPGGIAVTPDSKYAYASVFSTSTVLPFSIGSGGALTPISCTSPNCNTSNGPDFQSVVASPDQAPTAAFSSTAARPGQASSFNGSASTASTGQTVSRYDWNFGDGQTASNGGATPTHTYSAEGSYTVTLTVTDDAGCSTSRTYTGQTASCNGSSAATTSHTVSVDGTPPDTIIDSAAHGSSSDNTPSFDFHSTEAGSTFECSIDSGTPSYGPCSGPGASHTPSALADGSYTFRVRSTDAQGNTDASPATEFFTVETAPAPAATPGDTAPPACPTVPISVDPYIPGPTGTTKTANGLLGPTVPGLRVKITVAEPSLLQIHALLRWDRNGSPRSVYLGGRSLADPSMRNLRLALPASLATQLPRGTQVTIRFTIIAAPNSAPGCADPVVQRVSVRTTVVKVLAGSVQLRVKRGPARAPERLSGRPTS